MYIAWQEYIERTKIATSTRLDGSEAITPAVPSRFACHQAATRDLTKSNIIRLHGNIANQIRVFLADDPRTCAPGHTLEGLKMTNFKLLAVVAMLSTAAATPGMAQQAVQEPGMQAFYQSLGVGSQSSATSSAMASTRNVSVPAKRISTRHTNDRKM
jgi:hypothetical protein